MILDADQANELIGALREFIECARYSPDMGGNHQFMGWSQSDLRRAEKRARDILSKITSK